MEQIDYTKYLPSSPPEGLLGWVIQKGAFQKEYLIYKSAWEYEPLEDRNRKVVEVCCTACGRKFIAEREDVESCGRSYAPAPFGFLNEEPLEAVISGMTTKCPICGTLAEARHVTNVPHGIWDYSWGTSVHRIPVDGKRDRFCLVDWRYQRTITKEGRSFFDPHLWTAWVVEERKIIRIAGYRKNFTQLIPQAPVQTKRYYDDYTKMLHIQPFGFEAMEGTTAENSRLDLYIRDGGVRLVSYLALWRKKPAAENLVVQGYTKILDDLIANEMDAYASRGNIPAVRQVDWKKKRPGQMLHMEKWQERLIGRTLDRGKLEQLVWAEEQQITLETPEKLLGLLEIGGYQARELWKKTGALQNRGVENHTRNDNAFWRAVRYLQKDRTRTAGELTDYWEMARKLGMDLEEPQVRWPKKLKQAHDRAVERFNQLESEKSIADFQKRYEELAEFAWYRNGIFIRPCANEAELKAEGKQLHHCVATYAKRYMRGETAIFFIRRMEDPNTPWFTLELDEKELKVRQNRGKYNCARLPEIEEFEQAWLGWLRAKQATENKKGTNAA